MKKLLVLLIACLALTFTLAACGSDDSDDNGDGSSAGTTTTEQTDTTAAQKPSGGGGTATVDMKDIQFMPKDITVKAGTTITWTNSDSVTHTVTKEGGPGGNFDSGDVAPGDTFELTADVPGKVDYVCTIHPGQSGTFTVK
jgi:plastocyanin